MTTTAIHTEKAPAAVGPYSQGIRSGAFAFVSAQLPIDAAGTLLTDDLPSATQACLENVQAILAEGGAALEDIARITVYLTDMDDFAAVNTVYAGFFEGIASPPTRACIEVSALPKAARISMDAIAVTSD